MTKLVKGFLMAIGAIVILVAISMCATNRTDGSTRVSEGPVSMGGQTVTVAPSPSDRAPAGPLTSFESGTYQVGTDVVPGRYKTTGPESDSSFDSCYWERAKNDSGEFDAILANENLTGPGTVTLKDGEFFKARGSCEWVKQN